MEQYTTRTRAIFYDIETDATIANVSDDIVSLATQKAFGRCSGTWRMVLPYKQDKANKYYDKILQPNNVITIELSTNGGEYIPLMFGLVDRVSVIKTISANGAPNRQVQISGRDMGKLIEDHDIGWDILNARTKLIESQNPELGPPAPMRVLMASRLWNPVYQKGTADEMMYNLMNQTFDKEIKTSRFTQFVSDTDDKWQRHLPMFGTLNGRSLWSAMKEVEHAPYNILSTETTSTKKFTILLEKQPLDNMGMVVRTSDKTVVVADKDIISSDIGISDSERINLMFLMPSMYETTFGMSADTLMVKPDLVEKDEQSIVSNGYKQKTIKDMFLPPGMTNYAQPVTQKQMVEAQKLSQLYWGWHNQNHKLLAGTISTRVRPDIRAGYCLEIPQDNGKTTKFLVEHVSHSIIYGAVPNMQTSIQVTRGRDDR